jgi:hypothetical protein
MHRHRTDADRGDGRFQGDTPAVFAHELFEVAFVNRDSKEALAHQCYVSLLASGPVGRAGLAC